MPKFRSKHFNLRLTRRPHAEERTTTGAYRTVEQPVRYSFAPEGVLDVEEGQDLLPDGERIIDPETGTVKRDQFGNAMFAMQDAVSWLRGRPEYNSPEVIGGFTEDGRERDRIPEAGPDVRRVIAAMAQLDRAALVEIADAEAAAAWERPAVLAALEEAFGHVEAALAVGAAPGRYEDTEAGGTAGNGGEVPSGGDDLEAVEKMADLVAIGAGLGLDLGKPGQSKAEARVLIREARAQVAA